MTYDELNKAIIEKLDGMPGARKIAGIKLKNFRYIGGNKMKIDRLGTIRLYKVRKGQAFEFNGNSYIRITDYHDVNAADLETGNLYHIDPDQDVILYEYAKVVLI